MFPLGDLVKSIPEMREGKELPKIESFWVFDEHPACSQEGGGLWGEGVYLRVYLSPKTPRKVLEKVMGTIQQRLNLFRIFWLVCLSWRRKMLLLEEDCEGKT